MIKELEKVMIEDVEYSFDPEKEYIKDGHAYCKVCHERKDGKALEFFGKQMIFKTACKCDRDREAKEKERQKQLEIERLKSICFTSMIQWAYTFENYQGKENQSLIIAKNFVKDYELMRKENIGLLFYGTVGSGKTYLACSIANALIEQYHISVKIRNFAQIINELQKGGFDLDKNAYIESLVNTSVLILDDLGIERDTSYAKEQVYNIVNNRYLKHMFKEVADIQTADMLNLPTPEANYEVIKTEPSEEQKEILKSLSERADDVRNRVVEPEVDNMYYTINQFL